MDKNSWLNERKKGLGGSDIAAICGISPYRTPLQVWEEKRSLVIERPDNDSMFWGRTLEPVIRQRYSDETGRAVKLPDKILYHPRYNFMLANLDGFTDDNRGVEIKTAAYPTEWGEPGTDQIPLGYILQVQHYMMITALPVFDVPVLIGGRDFRIYEVLEDIELQKMLTQKESEFWELVINGIPPKPISCDDVLRLYKQSQEKAITATEEIEHLSRMLKGFRLNIKAYEQQEEEVKQKIMEYMKDADTLFDIAGKPLISWKTGKGQQRFDAKTFQKDSPEIYKKYLKTGELIRRFSVKGENKNGK